MALSNLCYLLFFLLFTIATTISNVAFAQVLDDSTSTANFAQLVVDDLDFSAATAAYPFGEMEEEEQEQEGDDGDQLEGSNRRALFWRIRYYISYGALSANRIPCPPRSGRSYYTHNCYRARGRANPYHRGCSAITRCRR